MRPAMHARRRARARKHDRGDRPRQQLQHGGARSRDRAGVPVGGVSGSGDSPVPEDGTVFQAAKRRAAEVVGMMREGDRGVFALAAAPVRVPYADRGDGSIAVAAGGRALDDRGDPRRSAAGIRARRRGAGREPDPEPRDLHHLRLPADRRRGVAGASRQAGRFHVGGAGGRAPGRRAHSGRHAGLSHTRADPPGRQSRDRAGAARRPGGRPGRSRAPRRRGREQRRAGGEGPGRARARGRRER